ncbi:hypothetical protein P154DRAFT_577287 [Amniculicola lignicola CBS 123094]|uniref:Uncharacterized protein n=1 Tax=Amniculicola lignicola CBS 123094 TaxID=1392246 RepID=A0A6A5WCH0_9PLEO|nr:hypothetical protein P154DRAFT_577287 [Amniculicola lignicola CBS 123094]
MAGRILPIALATVFGIATATATFGSELKEQQRKKLEEEYQRELAALSSQNSAASANVPKEPTQSESVSSSSTLEASPSGLSSLFGLWAWQKTASATGKKSSSDESNLQR